MNNLLNPLSSFFGGGSSSNKSDKKAIAAAADQATADRQAQTRTLLIAGAIGLAVLVLALVVLVRRKG